ncbi:hypothetical protein GCM10010245_91680 [Streptomyces spectabilis]|uniref:Transposase n=1 Tax=Streptomyces spectabilis TaxID=68270 RepID=A0A7W8B553_STRST|nr:hypothetical protein [Streptomyces spectabilis]GGV58567.1 hypothetical protein GCM10010245_91680 [Streptomyces spectabilis]
MTADFRISVSTACTHVRSVVTLLARRAPGLTAALRAVKRRAAYVLVGGTLTACDRADDSRSDYSGKNAAATA